MAESNCRTAQRRQRYAALKYLSIGGTSLEIECQCGHQARIEDGEELETAIRRLGWKVLDIDNQVYRCLDCRINQIEGCQTIRDEIG